MGLKEFLLSLSKKQLVKALLEGAKGLESLAILCGVEIREKAKWQPFWTIEKYDTNGVLYDTLQFEGNLLLNEGITEMLTLIIGGSATAYSNANTYIGVGDSETAVSASQTGLQAASNKLWKAMDDGYPSVSDQTVTFQSTFGSDDANFDWYEITVVNATDDTGENMNRKQQDMGRKAVNTTWVARVAITLS